MGVVGMAPTTIGESLAVRKVIALLAGYITLPRHGGCCSFLFDAEWTTIGTSGPVYIPRTTIARGGAAWMQHWRAVTRSKHRATASITHLFPAVCFSLF